MATLVPLYEGTQQVRIQPDSHAGLWFERWFNGYRASDFEIDESGEKSAKVRFLETLRDPAKAIVCLGQSGQLRSHWLRQRTLTEAAGGRVTHLRCDWHFVTGMGNPHPVENSLLFHHTLGVPYLPGSSVKGLVRAWIETHLENPGELLWRLFGSDHKDPSQHEKDPQAGEIVFFDALPLQPPELVMDTMTPHMGSWYESGGTAPDRSANQPGDWHDPTPIPFLAVRDTTLVFSFAPRSTGQDSESLLDMVEKVLSRALAEMGAGAKTAAGYGTFSALSDTDHREVKKLEDAWNAAHEQQQAERQRAALSEEQRILAELQEQASIATNQNPNTGGEFHNRLMETVRQCSEWPDEDRAALLEFAQGFFSKHGSKKKQKEFKQLKNSLG